MAQWICDKCGLKSPRVKRDELIDLGWQMCQMWEGKPAVYVRVQLCPKHKGNIVEAIEKKVKLKLKKQEDK